MRNRPFQLAWLGLAALAACSDQGATEPAAVRPAASAVSAVRTAGLTALTQNMYVGADLDAVIGALVSPDPDDDVPALLTAIQTLETTDFPSRAGALAREIARHQPDVIALQEVSTIDIDLTALGLPTVIHLDFLPTLLDSLRGRGLHYQTAASVLNIVAQPIPGISLQDRDVMLVNAQRVQVSSAVGVSYAANIGVVAPGVELKRGYVLVTGTLDGRAVAFVGTHLESGDSPDIAGLRALQASELVGALPPGVPLTVMGDFNDVPGSAAYAVMQQAGLTDSWGTLRPKVTGFTCCETPDLGTPTPVLNQRIDYVWVRGAQMADRDAQITRIGAHPGDRAAGPEHPVWPSDHAGLVLGTSLR